MTSLCAHIKSWVRFHHKVAAALTGRNVIRRDAEAGAAHHTQRQHSLPETSPGKSPARIEQLNLFKTPIAVKTKVGSAPRQSDSTQLDSPALPQDGAQARVSR